ncbi:class II fructose-bisphosphate aldolase family protein [Candidatus Woesearchaeota archaeon]|nr:class II fructose-bisphosphate aldolase family protein [Candidatus Woesearchaeota archaeon]
MLVSSKEVLSKAQKGRYAVGAFNVNDLEMMQAIVAAAMKLRSPVILQTTEGAIEYAGLKYLAGMIKTAAHESKIPIVLHLDHGKSLNTIKQCIREGYTSVMIDASQYEFRKNVAVTKKVVALCHKKGVSVEAELGTIGGAEDKVEARRIILTDPAYAKQFVEKTCVDSLAVAIGTSHGAYKFKGSGRLDIKRLKQIRSKVKIPLVLHGASGVPKDIVKKAVKYGAKLQDVSGVPDSQIQQAIKNGICKINTDTDLRLSFTAAEREFLAKNPGEFDPRKILNPAKQLVQQTVERRIMLFGSAGKG